MLDNVLSRLKEEIGIDGTQGSDIITVWKHLEDILTDISRELSITPVMDDKYKAYMWEYIKNMNDVQFYYKRDAPVVDQQQIDQNQATASTIKKPKVKKLKKPTAGKKRKVAVDSDDDYDGGGTSSSSSEEEEEEEEESEASIETESEEESETEDIKMRKKKNHGTNKRKNDSIDREPKKQNDNIVVPTQSLDQFEQVNVTNLSYSAVEKSFGVNLHIIASEAIQAEQLYKSLPPDCSNLSPNQVAVLREILKTRASGYYQANLTKYFGLDSRSTGHYCKVLEEKGAITRQRITVKGFYTNLCVHTKYKNTDNNQTSKTTSDDKPYNMNSRGEYINSKDICATIIELAKDADAKTILARDVLYALGFESNKASVKKWFNRCIHDLYEAGYIKKLKTQLNGQGSLLRCIQLLKDTMDDDSTAKDVHISENIKYPIFVETPNGKRDTRGVCLDMTLGRQTYRCIEESGERGVTQREMAVILNSDNSRVVYRYLELLSAKTIPDYDRFYICRHIEFDKRVRRYRYFTLKTYKKITEDIDEYTYPPLPEHEIDESKLTEVDSNYDFQHERKEYAAILKNSFKKPTTKARKKPMGRAPKKNKPDEEATTTTTTTTTKAKNKGTARKNTRRKTTITTSKNVEEEPSTNITSEQRMNEASNEPVVEQTQEPNEPVVEQTQEPNEPVVEQTQEPNEPVMMEQIESNERTDEPTPALTKELTPCQENTPVNTENENAPSAFNILMRSSRTKKKVAEPVSKSVVSMIKIPQSTIVKPKKPACAQAAMEETTLVEEETVIEEEATTREESTTVDEIIVLEEMPTAEETPAVEEPATIKETATVKEGTEKAVPNKRKKKGAEPVTRSKKSRKEVTVEETPSSQQSVDSQGKTAKKSLFDYFSRAKPIINKEKTPPPIQEEVEPMEINEEAQVEKENKEQEEKQDNEETENNEDAQGNEDTQGNEEGQGDKETREDEHQDKQKEKPFSESIFQKAQPIRLSRAVNQYLEFRKKTILHIVETDKVFVCSKPGIRHFKEVYEKVNGIRINGNPQKKTILVAAMKLKEEGLVQMTKKRIQGPSGKMHEFEFIVEKDVDMGGEEFEAIYRDAGLEKMLHGVVPHFKEIQRYHAPIERLDEHLERMMKDLEDKKDQKTAAQIEKIQSTINRFKSNSESISKYEPSPFNSFQSKWRLELEKSGFIQPRLLRAKVFHHHLFELCSKQEGFYEENSIVLSTKSIIEEMTVKMFLQVIGIRCLKKKTKEFVSDKKNESMFLEDLPPSITADIFSGDGKFRQFLRATIVMLTVLGIVEPMTSDTASMLLSHYKINKIVDVYDFRYLKEFSVVSTYEIKDETSFQDYWGALQYMATNTSKLEPVNLAPPIEDQYALDKFKSIYSSRSWSDRGRFNTVQIDILNSYVDFEAFTCPDGDVDLCTQIAKEIDMPLEHIITFYARLQKRFDTKLEYERNKLIRRSNGIPMRKRRNFRSGIVKKDRFYSPRYSKQKNADELIEMDHDNINLNALKSHSKKRVAWTEQEDEILLYSFIIIKHRTTSSREFRWTVVSSLLPNRSANSCRTRFDKVVGATKHRQKILAYQKLWTNFYKEGIENNDIVDENPRDVKDFDLVSFMEYFLQRLASVESISNMYLLPSKIETLQDQFDITRIKFDKDFEFIEENTYFQSLLNKLRYIAKVPHLVRSNRDDIKDSPLDAFDVESIPEIRQARILRLCSLMILLTPDENYDPFDGYNIIKQFPEELCSSVWLELKEEGLFIISKMDRSLPTTRWTISSKFMQSLMDDYSKDFYSEANNFENRLAHCGKIMFDSTLITGSSMACLLNLVSQRRLNITIPDHEIQKQNFEYRTSRSKNINLQMAHFDINIAMNDKPALDKPTSSTFISQFKPTIHISDKDDVDFTNLIATQVPEEYQFIAQAIVSFLKECADQGASAFQLKQQLSNNDSDKDILTCLAHLKKTTPPIVLSVGIDSERYVLCTPSFVSSWTISLKPDTVIDPTIWTGIQGTTSTVVFEQCKKRVMAIILQRPGIIESTIFRLTNKAMTRKEIRTILKELLDEKVIKRLKTTRKQKASIFSKTRMVKTVKENTIAESTETSYWPLSSYYSIV